MAQVKRQIKMKTKTKTKKLGILKVPVQLEDFKWRKGTQDWGITFSLQPENLKYGQPLQDEMNNHFVLALIKITDKKEALEVLKKEDIRGIEINP